MDELNEINSTFDKAEFADQVKEDNSLTLEQLSEIIDKLNRGEILEDDIRNKLDQDFKILVDDIINSSGHHPLADQPVYINSCLENENIFIFII